MPLVQVYYNGKVSIDTIYKLKEALPDIISFALHVEDNKSAHLVPGDIIIKTFDATDPGDLMHEDLEVIVFANFYPERYVDLESKRIPYINEKLDQIVPAGVEFSSYVNLGFGGYGRRPKA
jgi:hypothetical protein